MKAQHLPALASHTVHHQGLHSPLPRQPGVPPSQPSPAEAELSQPDSGAANTQRQAGARPTRSPTGWHLC